MRDFFYDFRRTFTGKFTIVMIVLIVLSSVGISYAGAVLSSSGSSGASPQATAYILPEIYQAHDGGYNFSLYAVNGYGQPVTGLDLNTNVSLLNYTINVKSVQSSVVSMANFTEKTNGQGFSYFSIGGNSSVNLVQLNYHAAYKNGLGAYQRTAELFINNNTVTFAPNTISASYKILKNSTNVLYTMKVANPSSQYLANEFVYYAAPNGTPSPTLNVYYHVGNGTSSSSLPPASISNFTLYKSISGSDHYVLTLPLTKTANLKQVSVALTNSTGTILGGNTDAFYSSVSTAAVLQALLQVPYEFLIPIIGIFSAYFYYGKDKTSGVLESVITRPVTKGRLFMSRYVGSAVTFLLALLIAIFLSDYVLLHYTGSLMSWTSFFGIVFGYTIEAIAFSGIMYILAQFVKSQGALLGIGIGLFFLLVFVWGVIVDAILYLLHTNVATSAGYSLSITLGAISPTFYPSMITSYVTGYYPPTFGITSSSTAPLFSASSLGITLTSVVAVGIVWILIPSLISFLLARSRD